MTKTIKQIKIFFAIPCGEFFRLQANIIKSVCDTVNIQPIIIEDYSKTDQLWKQITDAIDDADYFIADISSLSPNVVLELGYCLREKKERYYAIFIANNISVPVDLQGTKLQKYSSLADFKNKLISWMRDNLSNTNLSALAKGQEDTNLELREDFKDWDRFMRLWSTPPQCSYLLTHEGLRFTDAHMPIMTTYLSLLKNCRFTFKARIVKQSVGWIVQGTKPFNSLFPTFCIMFNLSPAGILTPHIFHYEKQELPTHYKVYEDHQVNIGIQSTSESWLEIETQVKNDIIAVSINGKNQFEQDFRQSPFGELYNDFEGKTGEVGFRCHPGEQAVVNYMKVNEL